MELLEQLLYFPIIHLTIKLAIICCFQEKLKFGGFQLYVLTVSFLCIDSVFLCMDSVFFMY